VFLNLKFSSFGNNFLIFSLNDSYFIYRNYLTFQIKHIGQYSEAIVVLKFKNISSFRNAFLIFLVFSPFTI